MNALNKILNTIFDLLLAPFKHADPFWGLASAAIITSIVILFIFKATSNQAGIRRAKNLVKAHFLAIRLYRDDVGLMFDTMKNIVMSNGKYLKESLRPMLFLLAPVGLILIQLGSRYDKRPLQVGESTILTVSLGEPAGLERLQEIRLQLPEGLIAETPPVRILQQGEVSWRIKAGREGSFAIGVHANGGIFKKQLQVGAALANLAPQIARDKFMITLLNPGETSLPSSAMASITVGYPKRKLAVLGMETNWLIVFFLLSFVAAFSLKGVLGIEL